MGGLLSGPWILLNFRRVGNLRSRYVLKRRSFYLEISLLDLLLGSTIAVDKPFLLNRIMPLSGIVCCERSVILWRISWDQNGMLCTGGDRCLSCSLDNNRLLPGIERSYPQLIAKKTHDLGLYLQNSVRFFDPKGHREAIQRQDRQFSNVFQPRIHSSAGSSGISCSRTSISRRSPSRSAPQAVSSASIFSMAPQKRSYSRLPIPTAP